MQALLEQARAIHPEDNNAERMLAPLAVELAGCLLDETRKLESPEELDARRALSQLLESPETQLFSTALTDRIHRSRSSTAAVRVLKELLERTGGGRSFTAVDRLQLRAARMFGPMVPGLTRKAVLARVGKEASPYLWDAEPEALRRHLKARSGRNIFINLNYLGEEVLGDKEAELRLEAYCAFATQSDIHAVSVKLSGIDPHLEVLALPDTVERLLARVRHLTAASLKRTGGPPIIYFDMEAYRDLAVTEQLLCRLLEEAPEGARLGVAIQAYLPESHGLVQRLCKASEARVKRGGAPLRLRLVKGANLQMERVSAFDHRLELPVFPTKAEVDAHFKTVLRTAIDSARPGHVHIGLGSHNLFDVAFAILLREHYQLGQSLQLEMLEGMAGALGPVASKLADGMLIYAPAVHSESFSSAVAYLVRRLDENTAPQNFLREAPHMERGDESFRKQAALFIEAVEGSFSSARSTFRRQDREAESQDGVLEMPLGAPFDNAPDTDFTQEKNRDFIKKHLEALKSDTNIRVEPLIATTGSSEDRETINGFDPSRPDMTYRISLATSQDIEEAIDQASDYSPYWLARTPRARIELLMQVAALLEKNRAPLIAAILLDGGKRVVEADSEVSEAVDFARYYAKQATKIEDNLDPRGVTVVAPPWNFPLAIPLGGVLAALVAGNTVIFKPAPETPLVGYLATKICYEAGIPREALSFLPCRDDDARPLITDPRVRAVVLTGATSTAQLFKKMRPDLCLMAETGGKNSAYVAPVSDRELAIADIVKSAFGHAGQKCSALSLLVLHREVFEDERFKSQLLDAARSLPVGSAWDMRSVVTPLIHPPSGALERILTQGESYGSWLLKPEKDSKNPRILTPGILWGIKPGSFAHMTELFGPVLSVLCVDSLDEAIRVMNQVGYGLTAGLFSLEEKDHEKFVNSIEAGNVYINRTITGAIVGRQPFGGFKDSCFGPGGKAGGPDYVRQMTVCRASALLEKKVLENREDDYDRAFDEHFRGVYPGTETLGEENYLRYLPGKTAVVLGEGAAAVDIRFALKARQLCRSDYPLMILDGPSANRTAHVLGAQRFDSVTAGAQDLVTRAQQLGVRRLRIIGTPDTHLLTAAAKLKMTTIIDPVSDVGRQELLYYLRAQSVSYAFHRHGNTSMRSLSRLQELLDLWS